MSIQTSDAALKAVQFPVSGFTLSGLTNSQLDTLLFTNCALVPGDGSASNVSHPVNVGNSNFTLTCNSAYVKAQGAVITYIMQPNLVPAVSGASSGAGTITLPSGSWATSVGIGTESIDNGAFDGNTCGPVFVTSQTQPLIASMGFGSCTQSETSTITADSATAFTLSFYSCGGGGGSGAGNGVISCAAATAVDVSGFGGSFNGTDSGTFSLAVGVPVTLSVAASIVIGGAALDTWSGSWTDDAITNAILAAYVAGAGSGGTLTIGGASPTGQGILDSATLTASGVAVMTN